MIQNSPRHPEVSLSVRIPLGTSKRSTATLKALIPDNLNFPEGLSLKMFARGSILSIEIHSKSASIETLLGRLDEILEHVSICQKVMPK